MAGATWASTPRRDIALTCLDLPVCNAPDGPVVLINTQEWHSITTEATATSDTSTATVEKVALVFFFKFVL